MILCQKDGNVGFMLPKSVIYANTKSVTTVDIPGSQSEYFVVLSAIVQTFGIGPLLRSERS